MCLRATLLSNSETRTQLALDVEPAPPAITVGTDQLLLNGYRATGGWGVAQGIIERHKQKENLAQKKARCAQDEAERSQGSAAGSSFAAM